MATIPLGVEDQILFPIKPSMSINRSVYQLDNQEFAVSKETTAVSRETITPVTFQIHIDNADTFFAFLQTNYNVNMTLNAPGYDIFLNNSASNTVRLVGEWKAVRIRAKFYRVTLNFLLVA